MRFDSKNIVCIIYHELAQYVHSRISVKLKYIILKSKIEHWNFTINQKFTTYITVYTIYFHYPHSLIINYQLPSPITSSGLSPNVDRPVNKHCASRQRHFSKVHSFVTQIHN